MRRVDGDYGPGPFFGPVDLVERFEKKGQANEQSNRYRFGYDKFLRRRYGRGAAESD